jgi:hypothetical protein
MFELRPSKELKDIQDEYNYDAPVQSGGFLKEIRRQSRVFVDEDEDDVNGEYAEDDAYEHVSRRDRQYEGGAFGDEDAGAEDVEDYGEAAFGDDESDDAADGAEAEVQNVGAGLGIEGRPL